MIKPAIYYWIDMDQLLITKEFYCNKEATRLDLLGYEIRKKYPDEDDEQTKKPKLLQGGISLILNDEHDTDILFSSHGTEELIYIGEL